MLITDSEIILENVFMCWNWLYTDEVTSKELREIYGCGNVLTTQPVNKLPVDLKTICVEQPVILHDPNHSITNIGHYFNEHLYSLVVSWLTHKCEVFLYLPRNSTFLHEDTFTLKDSSRYGSFCWGASILKSLGLKFLPQNQEAIYQIKQLILPRTNRWMVCDNINGIDPLVYIRSKVIETMNPISTPYDILFLNKKSDRNVINDKEIIEYLDQQKIAYKVVESLSDFSFTEVVALFYNAKTVLAPWGSHLTNVLFMNPFSTVYELHPLNMRDSWWRIMQKIFKERCNINYVNIPCNYIEQENKKRENTAVNFDISLLNLNN